MTALQETNPVSSPPQDDKEDARPLLPKGTCLPCDIHRHHFLHSLMLRPDNHLYCLPYPSLASTFVLVRQQSGLSSPLYRLHYHPSAQLLLTAREQSLSIGCNYVISKLETAQGAGNVGKLRGKFGGGVFQVYDAGQKPQRVNKGAVRNQLSLISIQKQGKEEKGRTGQVLVPCPREVKQQTLKEQRMSQPGDLTCSEESPSPIAGVDSTKDGSLEELTLRVGTRQCGKSVASLVGRGGMALQMERQSETMVEVEMSHPLTIVQGFAISLACLQMQMV